MGSSCDTDWQTQGKEGQEATIIITCAAFSLGEQEDRVSYRQ